MARSVQPNDIDETREMNMRKMQNVLLVWMDNDIDKNSTYCRSTVSQLQQVMTAINVFNDGDECYAFLEELCDDKACLIISERLGQVMIPCVHHMSQIDSIFIFTNNKQQDKQWPNEWSKVRGVYTDMKLICDALKESVQDCEQNAIAFSLVATGHGISKKNLDQLDPMFMYSQILKEILLEIKFEEKHISDFIQYCQEILKENKAQLDKVKKFEEDYYKETPIWWYTWESFLYPMLNRALRLSDIDVIIKMGFFIRDLHRQIDQLHQQQFSGINTNKNFIVYRGQGMSEEEFAQVSKAKGGLISFNNFLSTSQSETVSTRFARRALRNPETVGVLFVMKIDPTQSTAPFASVNDVGAYKDRENEILFAMHTVFRIKDAKQMDETPRLFRVELELTRDNEKDLQVLTKYIREETLPQEEEWNRLGLVLIQLGKSKEAEKIFRILLEQETAETNKAHLYNRLVICKQAQGEDEEAIRLNEKSIEIQKKYSLGESNLAVSYNNIGSLYRNMGDYVKALSYYGKVLVIRQQSLPPNHPDLAFSYDSIGNLYLNTGEYTKALSYYEKTLAIQQQSLSTSHPDLASSYNNIGLIYSDMGEYAKSLLYYEKALAVKQQSLPPNHVNLASTYNNIGNLHQEMKNYSKAYSFYEKSVKIGEQFLPPNHPHLQKFKRNLDSLKNKL